MRASWFHSFILCFLTNTVISQTATRVEITNNNKETGKAKKHTIFGNGLNYVAGDSSMSMKFTARMQTLFIADKSLSDNSPIDKEMMVRRFRLKFDGFAFSPRLIYKIELALSNRDLGAVTKQTGNAPNIVLDAVLKYKLSENSELWFGQTKLPGNRERIISSQNLQFVDRSLVNSLYNLDRDLGLQFHHKMHIGKAVVKDIYAISLGQGRNITVADTGGLSYTGRLEVLPFGEFTNKGDYFDADLARESKPKLSLAAGFSYNDGAMRKNGELGSFLNESRDLKTFFTDVMFKYRGLSVTSEFMNKQTDSSPLLKDNSDFYQVGNGWNIQSGYLLKNNMEISGRYTVVNPSTIIKAARKQFTIKEYTIGSSKYFKGHNFKIQSDVSYVRNYEKTDGSIRYRFQVELGF